jgi:hypothetical protein
MSSSRHPVALSVERRVGSSTRLLAVVMCLPLVDGVFVAVVLGGALETLGGIIEVGLLVFAGSATIAVILAEMDAGPRAQARIVLGVGSVVIAGAAVQATLAPTIESLLNMAIFERFAALVVLGVAASTASARLDEYLPGPPVVLGLGLVASLEPAGASLALQTDPGLIARAVAAAAVGVLVALAVAVTSPWLRTAVEIDRFRFGSAVALGVLALSIAGFIPSSAPVALAVLLVTALLAFDPDGSGRDPLAPGDTDAAIVADGGNGSTPSSDGTPLDTDTGIDAGASVPADVDPVADTDAVHSAADTTTGSDADVSSSAGTTTESDAGVHFATGVDTGIDAVSSAANAGTGSDADVHFAADVDAGTHSPDDVDAGTHSTDDADAGTHSSADVDAGTHSSADADAGTHSSADIDTGVHSPADVDTRVGSESETETGNAQEFDGDHWPPEQQPPWF